MACELNPPMLSYVLYLFILSLKEASTYVL